ncbi:DNA polymerase III subunit delta [Candidatus Mycoplasma mahonii]|uniref:DNA polymerase III subunit delta n=1 Tax=Candidatus Mycoplasma mahonii TaxID=3004105 RepID=UPI0026EE37E4|nr:DNA polymerase III subunit delta [Candidatus Mycoplasma mahonii]WKX02544.1 DNA polymerase III subunit delta [Candidatus Mycoplasma mahonii]
MIFIYGEEQYFIDKKLNSIIKKEGLDPIKFDEASDLASIIAEIATISWFSEKKLIVLKNIKALTGEEETQEIINALNTLDDSLEVVIINNFKIKKSNSLVKFLLKNADIHEVKSLDSKDMASTIREIVISKGGSITNAAAINLGTKVPNDLRIIISEIDKLMLESQEIDKDQIERSIGEYVIEDAFSLSNAISAMDKNGIIYSYNKMIKNNEESTVIISKIASVFLFALKVNQYKKLHMNNMEIATKMNAHIFRIKKASELISTTTNESIKGIIIKLAHLDKNIKTGNVNDLIGLNDFMLNLIM